MTWSPPSVAHLSRLYYELGKCGAKTAGQKKPWPYKLKTPESLFVLGADWSRFDPRLLQILVEFGISHWPTLLPQAIRKETGQMKAPQTLGVITAFMKSALPKDHEISLFCDYLTEGLRPVPTQYYFFNLFPPGSPSAEKTTKESLSEFKVWGFLGRDRVVIDSFTKKSAGSWDPISRINILKRLLRSRKEIQISDYLEELHHSISRQQAILDLKSIQALQNGKGRGTFWKLNEKGDNL